MERRGLRNLLQAPSMLVLPRSKLVLPPPPNPPHENEGHNAHLDCVFCATSCQKHKLYQQIGLRMGQAVAAGAVPSEGAP